jgi:hypothetical protein
VEQSWSYLTSVNVTGIPTEPWLRGYSRLKLGFADALEYYAAVLADRLTAEILIGPSPVSWWVTGPPVAAIPAAANHLARLVACRAAGTIPSPGVVRGRELRKRRSRGHFPGSHYAVLDEGERMRFQEEASREWVRDDGFAGCGVVVVNDADVTGAQERMLGRFLTELGVVRVHWQYVVKVQLSPGSDPSRVEPLLNDSTMSSAEAFRAAAVEGMVQLRPTTKFLWRLFESDPVTFDVVRHAMPAPLRAELVRLLDAEGFVLQEAAQERRQLLLL